jgi:hypothetical protein
MEIRLFKMQTPDTDMKTDRKRQFALRTAAQRFSHCARFQYSVMKPVFAFLGFNQIYERYTNQHSHSQVCFLGLRMLKSQLRTEGEHILV